MSIITLMILPAIPLVFLKQTRWHRVIILITVLALILSFANCLTYIKLPRTVNWRDAASEVKENIQDGDVVLVLPQGAVYVFNFYFQNYDDTEVTTLNMSKDLDSFSSEFLKGRRRLWIIRNQVLAGDRTLKVVDWFDQKYGIIKRNDKFDWLDIVLVNLMLEPKPAVNEQEAAAGG